MPAMPSHLDELLDEGLKEIFAASVPRIAGHFIGWPHPQDSNFPYRSGHRSCPSEPIFLIGIGQLNGRPVEGLCRALALILGINLITSGVALAMAATARRRAIEKATRCNCPKVWSTDALSDCGTRIKSSKSVPGMIS
jgi:hypothetical protein